MTFLDTSIQKCQKTRFFKNDVFLKNRGHFGPFWVLGPIAVRRSQALTLGLAGRMSFLNPGVSDCSRGSKNQVAWTLLVKNGFFGYLGHLWACHGPWTSQVTTFASQLVTVNPMIGVFWKVIISDRFWKLLFFVSTEIFITGWKIDVSVFSQRHEKKWFHKKSLKISSETRFESCLSHLTAAWPSQTPQMGVWEGQTGILSIWYATKYWIYYPNNLSIARPERNQHH